MNKGKIFFGMAIIISALLLACSPTEVSAQSAGNEQRLVGSWTSLHNNTMVVFNANGTLLGDFALHTHWAAAGDILLLFGNERAPNNLNTGFWQVRFQISSDGGTLIFGERAFRRN